MRAGYQNMIQSSEPEAGDTRLLPVARLKQFNLIILLMDDCPNPSDFVTTVFK